MAKPDNWVTRFAFTMLGVGSGIALTAFINGSGCEAVNEQDVAQKLDEPDVFETMCYEVVGVPNDVDDALSLVMPLEELEKLKQEFNSATATIIRNDLMLSFAQQALANGYAITFSDSDLSDNCFNYSAKPLDRGAPVQGVPDIQGVPEAVYGERQQKTWVF